MCATAAGLTRICAGIFMGLKQIRTRRSFGLGRGAWALAALVLVTVGIRMVQARSTLSAPAGTPSATTVALDGLPAQGVKVLTLVRQGGPFPFEKDGTVFGNRERQLPSQKRGYYREYTVPTPGLSHRGARRIVCGGQQPIKPDACYYSGDHYASFRLIVQ